MLSSGAELVPGPARSRSGHVFNTGYRGRNRFDQRDRRLLGAIEDAVEHRARRLDEGREDDQRDQQAQ
jgi:hypothetical protein